MRIDSLASQNMQVSVKEQSTEALNDKTVKADESKTEEPKNTQETKPLEERDFNKNITARSKDGDTLVISSEKSSSKKIMTKIPDASLVKYSKTQLQKMLKEEKITRQQYEKAVNGK